MLVGVKFPRAAQTGLHFVANEQCPSVVHRRLHLPPAFGAEFVDAFALNGLGDEGGHVTAAELLFQDIEITEGNLDRTG